MLNINLTSSVSHLPFLRPLSLFTSHLTHISRPISTAPRLRQHAATVTGKIPVPSLSPEISPTDSALRPLPYHVHRTASQGLPVYHLAKRGGNLHQTRVRKVEGDLKALKDDLQQALGLKKEDVAINWLSRQIIIKGWRRNDVLEFLQQLRF